MKQEVPSASLERAGHRARIRVLVFDNVGCTSRPVVSSVVAASGPRIACLRRPALDGDRGVVDETSRGKSSIEGTRRVPIAGSTSTGHVSPPPRGAGYGYGTRRSGLRVAHLLTGGRGGGSGPGESEARAVWLLRRDSAAAVVVVGRQRTSEVGRHGKGSSSSMARRVSDQSRSSASGAVSANGSVVVALHRNWQKLTTLPLAAGQVSANWVARGKFPRWRR